MGAQGSSPKRRVSGPRRHWPGRRLRLEPGVADHVGMSNATSTVVATAVIIAVLGTVLIVGTVKIGRRTHVTTVIGQLRKRGTYSVRAGILSAVWTPENPAPGHLPLGFDQMLGRGVATYRTNREIGTVTLHWQPKSGPFREWTGPIPVVAWPGIRERLRRDFLIAGVVFLGTAVVGLAVGAAIKETVVGLAAGVTVGYFIGVWIWTSGMVRAFRVAAVNQGDLGVIT